MQSTTASVVADLRDGDTDVVRVWAALGSPCASIYVPLFLPDAIPTALAEGATWRRFAALRDRVEADGSALVDVRAILGPVETELWETADAIAGDPAAHRPFAVTAWRAVDAALDQLDV